MTALPLRRAPTAAFPLAVLLAGSLVAQEVDVREHVLDNGLKVLLVPRPGDPNVACGWIAKVGSVHERPGITGTAHLFEHMMFKGTRVIGTRDLERDLEIISELDRVKAGIAEEEAALRRRWMRGEIDDPDDPRHRSARHEELLERFRELLAEQKEIVVKDEFDRIYSAAGATGMNAGTTQDFTIYFINVPANKLELWFWMESDRLLHPVFREFWSERDVVREERRLRVESTPTGRYEEQFDALFWTSSPYSWPVIGWPSDVEDVTRREARTFYDRYYAPGNLTACLVGDFDTEEAVALAERYFGRLAPAEREPAPVRTAEVPQVAEKRMSAEAPTRPQAVVRWHTVPDGHRDEPAFLVLQGLLEGRTGRLYKKLVLEEEVSNEAHATHRGLKYGGYFEIRAVAKDEVDPTEVEASIERLAGHLGEEPVTGREVQKVKNQWAAREYRKLRTNLGLMFELLIRDAYRGWETIRTDPERIREVTAEDVRRVAAEYFREESRAVLLYHTETPEEDGGGEAVPPWLARLGPEERAHVERLRAQAERLEPEQVRSLLAELRKAQGSVDEAQRDVLEAGVRMLEEHLAGETSSPGEGEEAAPSGSGAADDAERPAEREEP